MNTETDTCSRCERRRHRRIKPGRIVDLILIAVLLVDVWVTWGRPAVPCACPTAGQGAR